MVSQELKCQDMLLNISMLDFDAAVMIEITSKRCRASAPTSENCLHFELMQKINAKNTKAAPCMHLRAVQMFTIVKPKEVTPNWFW